jgi:hypothetical protein
VRTPNKNISLSFRELNSNNSAEDQASVKTPVEEFVDYFSKWFMNEILIENSDKEVI